MSEHDRDHDRDCWKKEKEPCAVMNVYCNSHEKPHPHPKPCPCPKECPKEFAQAYSIKEQTLFPSPGINQPGQAVLLENLKVSTANIDASQAGVTGEFEIKVAGWYEIGAAVCAFLNPLPVPLPCWTVSLFKNGVLIPGVTFSNVPISPAQGSNELTAESFEHFKVGDKLKLANTSTNQLFLSAPPLGNNPGTNVQTLSAYMKVNLQSCDNVSVNPLVDAANNAFIAVYNSASLMFVAATTVNLSQNPIDASTAQAEANNTIASIAAAGSALAAAAPFVTPASLALANANMANVSAKANQSLVDANNAVASLTPANTAVSVASSGQTLSSASLLAAQQLVAM